jgi:hypothetical protein
MELLLAVSTSPGRPAGDESKDKPGMERATGRRTGKRKLQTQAIQTAGGESR